MKGSLNQPKIFISYSWSSPKHEQWVLSLAERLSNDWILVVLDKWDLKEGQDKHKFMEQMVNDQSINKVLVICDSIYQNKANERTGGVGTESQLISKEVYENTSQEKFIPIAVEFDEKNKPCIPSFMSSRIYIDLSSDEKFEENYQRLVRNLYNKPELKRPPMGTPPAYITEDDPTVLKTSHKVQEIKNALLNSKAFANSLISDYYELFLNSLEEFRVSGGQNVGFDDIVMKSVERMLPLRNDFIDFIFVIFKYQGNVDLDNLKEFFERLYRYQLHPENVQTSTEIDFDNYKFFCYEIMLYVITILLKLKRYSDAAFFVHSEYYFKKPFNPELNSDNIWIFNPHIRSLDDFRNKRLQLRRVSFVADLIKERADRKDVSFNELIDADLILYYLRSLEDGYYPWFPRLSCYNSWGSTVEFFQRQVSKEYFEKVKILYKVKSKGELQIKVAKYTEDIKEKRKRTYEDFNYRNLQALERVIKVDDIATKQ